MNRKAGNHNIGISFHDYADDQYAESCKEWCDFADRKCGSLSEADQKNLGNIFEKAGYLELDFWNMAYKRKRA